METADKTRSPFTAHCSPQCRPARRGHSPVVALLRSTRGFSLVEVLIVIAIIGTIAAIAIPFYQRYQIRTQANAALAEASALRVPVEAQVLGIGPPVQPSAQSVTLEFHGNDSATITAVRALGQLDLARDDNGRWLCSHTFNTALPDCQPIPPGGSGGGASGLQAFSDSSSYRQHGSWDDSDDGLRSNFGRLYIPNTDEEYDFTVQATLGGDSGGGFGLLFDTSLPEDSDTDDSGFVLQYDRGLNGFVIRQRTDGNEAVSDHSRACRVPLALYVA